VDRVAPVARIAERQRHEDRVKWVELRVMCACVDRRDSPADKLEI